MISKWITAFILKIPKALQQGVFMLAATLGIYIDYGQSRAPINNFALIISKVRNKLQAAAVRVSCLTLHDYKK